MFEVFKYAIKINFILYILKILVLIFRMFEMRRISFLFYILL